MSVSHAANTLLHLTSAADSASESVAESAEPTSETVTQPVVPQADNSAISFAPHLTTATSSQSSQTIQFGQFTNPTNGQQSNQQIDKPAARQQSVRGSAESAAV